MSNHRLLVAVVSVACAAVFVALLALVDASAAAGTGDALDAPAPRGFITASVPEAPRRAPTTSTVEATVPEGTARPSADRDLAVAVVGDSMFAVGASITRAVIETTPGVQLVHWEAISGRAISDHPSALTAHADVVVTTFAYNDVALHDWPGARPWLERFVAAHADSEIIWVLFDPGTSEAMSRYYNWLTNESRNRPNLRLVDFGPLHDQRNDWICGDACGGLGFHLEPGHGGVAVMAAMVRSELEHLMRRR